jgi:hypothetical protein
MIKFVPNLASPDGSVFLLAIFCYNWSGDDPQEEFNHILLPAKYESKILKTSFYVFGYLLEQCMKIWWFFLKFGWILVIENLKKHIILALLIFNTTFWLYMTNQKKKVA